MAKRRHSAKRYKRTRTRSKTRAISSSKRGGENTPTDGRPATFYNTETGKPTKTNVEFLDPTKISNVKNTDQVFPGIFEKSDIDAEEVFSQEPEFYSKASMDKRKRTAAAEEFNRLTKQYETEFPKPASKQMCNEETGIGCNIMGGLRRRKNSRRKTFKRKNSKRKSFKRKTFKRKSRRY